MNESKIRNVVVLGHLQSGKTSLTEALYSIASGKEKGSVEKKTTLSDYTLEEQKRLSSIKTSVIPLTYNDYKINLLDEPGSDDFVSEIISSISVVKGAILVLDAINGVEVGTIKHWNMLKKRNIPTIIYVNKMDKPGVNFEHLLEEIRTKLGKNAIPFCYPMGHNDSFDGFINVVTLKARKYNGKTCEDAEIYPDKRLKVLELHNTMVEAVATNDEILMEKFFNGEELTKEEINKGLRDGVLNGELIPVLVGSANKNIGIHTLLQMIIDYMPNPSDLKALEGYDENNNLVERKTLDNEPFSAIVFKTYVDAYSGIQSTFKINSGTLKVGDNVLISNINKTITIQALYQMLGSKLISVNILNSGDIGTIVKVDGLENSMTLCDPKNKITYKQIEYPTSTYFKALVPKTKNDEDKLSQVLSKMMLEDKSLSVSRNEETNQLLIGTLGLGQLNYILERMKNSYKLNVDIEDYKIVYRETITKSSIGNGRYVKQSGGSGFFGVVEMEFSPNDKNEFKEEVFGGAVPKNYFPAVEKGFYEATEKGLLAGYPVIGVKAVLKDGKYHPVDSNELAFKMAAILAFKDAYMKCNPIILEPIIKIVVTVSSLDVGDVLSDLSQRRAKIVGMEINSAKNQKITALVPEGEILEYVNDLKSITQGSGYFNREFYDYEEAPKNISDALIGK